MNNQKQHVILGLLLMVSATAQAFAPTNFFMPDDPNYRLTWWEDRHYADTSTRIGLNVEYGACHSGRDEDSDRANILRLFSDDQATIPMLMNNPDNTKAADLLHDLDALWSGQADDDGILGHVKMSGHFEMVDTTLHAEYAFPLDCSWGHFSLYAGLPIRYARINDVSFEAMRRAGNPMDLPIFERLNGPKVLPTVVKSLGGPNLGCWDKTGLGDLLIQLRWQKSFRQSREYLKRVDLSLRAGFTAPTGVRRDEDEAFSMAFGNDGAWGFPIGGGLALNIGCCARIGIDVDFLVLLEETHTRRIKTVVQQTEFLLLSKAKVTKDHGIWWRINAFTQAYHICGGLSLTAAYEFLKKESDTLTPCGNNADSSVINSACSLGESNSHNLIFRLNYDFCCDDRAASAHPHFSFFCKVPVAGRSIIDPTTFGGQLAVTF